MTAPKPLNLFIHPPYQPTDTPPGSWTKLNGYGDELPPGLRSWLGERAEVLLLEAAAADAMLYACATGYISLRFPDDRQVSPLDELPPADTSRPEPETATLYLHPRPFLDLAPGFKARAEVLTFDPTAVPEDTLGIAKPPPGTVIGFIYLNVDLADLKANLWNELSSTELAQAAEDLMLGATSLPPATTPAQFESQWRHFLDGRVSFPVSGGEALCLAGPPIHATGTQDSGQVGFGVLTSDGTVDPAHFYDWLRDFVTEEADLDAFLSLAPVQWPLIDPALSDTEVIHLTGEKLFPYVDLEKVRQQRGLTRNQWRLIGDNQKTLYRERLLQRVGLAPAGSTAPHFSFNDFDGRNLFQLEAVVEFYANFSDPRDILETPVLPTTAAGDPNPDYTRVDLLPLSGREATVAGSQVTLDGSPDLTRVWPGRDTIWLRWDSARPSRRYTITDVNPAAFTVTVDGNPSISPIAETEWYLDHRPALVVIDSFGGRMQGSAASVLQVGANATTIKLDDGADLTKINQHGFDTVYFYADTADWYRPRTYPVLSADNNAKTITIEGQPDFAGGLSAWHIPAGIGGRLPVANYQLGPNAVRGWDHYDGTLFIVANGVIDSRYRWTSYTSHSHVALEGRSSIRGNRQYFYRSYRSGSDFRNFSFKITDAEALLRGTRAVPGAGPNQVILDGDPDLSLVQTGGTRSILYLASDTTRQTRAYETTGVDNATKTLTLDANPNLTGGSSPWELELYDGVRENRHYFEAQVTEDTAAPGVLPASPGAGKTQIRYHYGSTINNNGGSGSAGCVVSLVYYAMRNRLIELYQDEWAARHGPGQFDPDIDDVYGLKTHAENRAGFAGIPTQSWTHKIVGPVWLIRPDERPLG